MSEQLFLTGMPEQSSKKDRLFFAIFPDADACAQMTRLAEQLCARHGLKGKPRAAALLHVTMHFVGDFHEVSDSVVQAAGMAASQAVATMRPFEVTLDHVKSFANRSRHRPCVLVGNNDNTALVSLHCRLITAFGKRDDHFTPHVTLLYDDVLVPEESVDPVRWSVRELVLVHNVIGKGCYQALGRWALQG